MVASDAGQFLGEDLGLPVSQVGVLGNDGCLRHHNSGASVLKVGVYADVVTWKSKVEKPLSYGRTLELQTEKHCYAFRVTTEQNETFPSISDTELVPVPH